MALVLVPVLVIVGYMAFSQKDQQLPSEQKMKVQVEETTEQNTVPVDSETVMESEKQEAMVAGKVIPVVANNFSYDVKEIKVKQGEKATVLVTNSEGFHDFVIDELEVNSGMIKAGETMELEIPTDKPGTYEFYCSVGQHRQMGMKGILIVE